MMPTGSALCRIERGPRLKPTTLTTEALSMNKRTIGYWVATALVALPLAAGGAAHIARAPDSVASMTALGFPAYVMTILGIWKLLGAAAIVAPRFPRLKEWAYAGMFFL